jgi:hypothetical protein
MQDAFKSTWCGAYGFRPGATRCPLPRRLGRAAVRVRLRALRIARCEPRRELVFRPLHSDLVRHVVR